jgi:hypothetical protein
MPAALPKVETDIPTIIRNRWENEKFAKVRPPERQEQVSADEYDIPAFLRRRVE